MCNLAYIGATVLNFELAWPADVCASKTLAHDPALSVYYLQQLDYTAILNFENSTFMAKDNFKSEINQTGNSA